MLLVSTLCEAVNWNEEEEKDGRSWRPDAELEVAFTQPVSTHSTVYRWDYK